MAGVLISLAVLAFWLYSLFDVITSPEEETRNLPKVLWVLIVVVLPVAGSVLWFLLGRPRVAPGPPRAMRPRPETPSAPPPKGPEDDPEFLKELERRLRGED
ncbi:PLDc N-terminal domain-containing protein [Thermoactinospora rubra]|uniref:PLDc N-terminal domain-containing protein n=1 Tax=Thermoactinospora rubra TaxID=1088767 RepID=UPI000A0FC7C6|nr:PLDc N-terminal domain-containing protein [Thermoactinospora rubra]